MSASDKPRMFCEECGEFRNYRESRRSMTVTIRGQQVTADVPVVTCPDCGSIQPDPSPDADPMVPLYAQFRRQNKLLSPSQIREIREQYGMSHETFAAVTGMSPATLHRYEGGALQDDVHNALILLCREPSNMLRLVERDPGKLTPVQMKRFALAMRSLGHSIPYAHEGRQSKASARAGRSR